MLVTRCDYNYCVFNLCNTWHILRIAMCTNDCRKPHTTRSDGHETALTPHFAPHCFLLCQGNAQSNELLRIHTERAAHCCAYGTSSSFPVRIFSNSGMSTYKCSGTSWHRIYSRREHWDMFRNAVRNTKAQQMSSTRLLAPDLQRHPISQRKNSIESVFTAIRKLIISRDRSPWISFTVEQPFMHMCALVRRGVRL